MKNLVKISLVFAIAMLIGVGVSHAQSAASPASARVESELTIVLEDGTAIDFGALSATTPGVVRLDPNSFTNNVSVNPTTANVAQFNVVGSPDTGITVTYDEQVELVNGDDAGIKLTMNSLVVGDAEVANKENADPIGNNTDVTLEENAGTYFIWVGGELPQLTNQATGTYTGTFNISVAYN
jgi:hypothetical protein